VTLLFVRLRPKPAVGLHPPRSLFLTAVPGYDPARSSSAEGTWWRWADRLVAACWFFSPFVGRIRKRNEAVSGICMYYVI
jgi:hypothetical protein